jgi:hypothetical protein
MTSMKESKGKTIIIRVYTISKLLAEAGGIFNACHIIGKILVTFLAERIFVAAILSKERIVNFRKNILCGKEFKNF